MKRPKVSVIISVYNREAYIAECLDSMLAQTLKEIEVICINDGSTDGSLDILKSYRKKDSRIKVIDKENSGCSSSRNVGLEKSTAEYVMFCDSDDTYDSRMCEKMVNALEKNDVDVAICGIGIKYLAHQEAKKSDEAYYEIKFEGKQNVNEKVIHKTDASVCNKIFRKNVIEKRKIKFPDGINNEDYYFYNAYMIISDTAYFIKDKLYNYIRHENSIMSDNFNKDVYSPDHLLVAQRLFTFYKKNHFLEQHLDLFWVQFAESFWFSYGHSAKKYHRRIYVMAKKFIAKNYKTYQPSRLKTKRLISEIYKYNFTRKAWRKVKNIAKRVIRKVIR